MLSVALALGMALWVNQRIVGRGWLRLAYFTPTVLPMIAVANIWLFFYTPDHVLQDQIRSLHALGLAVFAGTDQGIDWSIINAATLTASAPLLIAFLIFQR